MTDNAPEFADIDLHEWLRKIGCRPYKTPPYHPQSNGTAERMVQTVKKGIKACLQQKEEIDAFLPRLLLSYRTIPHAGRPESPSALMGRQLRSPLTMSYATNQKMSYKRNRNMQPESAEFIIQKGHNTAILNKENGNSVLVHADQIRSQGEESDEEMPSEMPIIDVTEELMQSETAEEEVEWDELEEDQSMQEEQFDHRRDRSRSPRERREIGEDVQEGTRRSTRSTRGIRPLRYREMW